MLVTGNSNGTCRSSKAVRVYFMSSVHNRYVTRLVLKHRIFHEAVYDRTNS